MIMRRRFRTERRAGTLRSATTDALPLMKATTVESTSPGAVIARDQPNTKIPLWLKLAFTGFMAVLVPVYLYNYGPTNFLYFCDTALLLTLVSIWTENSLPVSMAAVGILIPQFFWCVDFFCQLLGFHLTGLTSYMFDSQRSLFLRGLSLFHGWLPFLLVYLVLRLGYDRRALKAWTALAWLLCVIAFFFLPPAGATLADPKLPLNVNLVFGFDDAHPQKWMPQGFYVVGWMLALFILAYVPTDLMLKKMLPDPGGRVRLMKPAQ